MVSLIERCFLESGGESGFPSSPSSIGLLRPLEREEEERGAEGIGGVGGGWSRDVSFSGTD